MPNRRHWSALVVGCVSSISSQLRHLWISEFILALLHVSLASFAASHPQLPSKSFDPVPIGELPYLPPRGGWCVGSRIPEDKVSVTHLPTSRSSSSAYPFNLQHVALKKVGIPGFDACLYRANMASCTTGINIRFCVVNSETLRMMEDYNQDMVMMWGEVAVIHQPQEPDRYMIF